MIWIDLACSWVFCLADTAWALGFRPFYKPLPIDDYWLLLALPMVVAISVVFKAIKLDDLSQLPRQATVLVAQIIFFLVLAASGLWLITALV